VVREMYLARVKKPADSKGPWDYFEIVRKIAPEETVWPLSATRCAAAKL
jgi:branched-chain amino acid transport system substrate-binding protein